ncbi:reverse transcriptase domain-containing protein [Tanacetum coccineum]
MNPSYSNNVLTKSYEDAWPEMKQHKFFDSVIADRLEDIMASPPPQGKSSRPSSTSHMSFAMRVNWSKSTMHGIDFMGPFLSSNRNKYILVAIDYVPKWVEAQAFPTSDAGNVGHLFLQLLNGESNETVWSGSPVLHSVSPSDKRLGREYKPRTKAYSQKNHWEQQEGLVDDTLWAFQTAFKASLGTNPFRIIYGKACHLLANWNTRHTRP